MVDLRLEALRCHPRLRVEIGPAKRECEIKRCCRAITAAPSSRGRGAGISFAGLGARELARAIGFTDGYVLFLGSLAILPGGGDGPGASSRFWAW